MTTLVPFNPAPASSPPWRTIFTLDGSSVVGTSTWNVYAQRWYLSLTDQAGSNLWTGPLIGSPDGFDILLAPDVFATSTILYREGSGNFEVNP